ncbi:unnamed protein product [Closterium sp. NIES-53]
MLRTPRPSFCHITTRAGTSTGPPPPRYHPPLLHPPPPPSPPLLPPHPPPPLLPSPTQQSFCITDSAIPTSPHFAPLSPLASFTASLPPYPPSPLLLLPHAHRAFMASSSNPPITAIPPLLPPPLTLSTWISGCCTYFKRPIGRLHSDDGGEFINNTLATFCKTHGIQQTTTLPHSPQKNVIAESRIREITKIAHCLIAHASTPPSLWSYALLLNLRSHPQHPSSSPTELWSKAKPDAAGLRVWGCKSAGAAAAAAGSAAAESAAWAAAAAATGAAAPAAAAATTAAPSNFPLLPFPPPSHAHSLPGQTHWSPSSRLHSAP